jgi:hypothetical protein
MSHIPSNGSRRRPGAPQRLPRHFSSSSRQRSSFPWNRLHSYASLLAVAIAVFGLLVGSAVLDREQRLQLREVIQ